MKYRISVTRIEIMNMTSLLAHFLALSPMRFLFQIAWRHRTSRIFTSNEVNTVMDLLTSAILVLESHDKTHSVASSPPKRHLMNGNVRQINRYIWYIPLKHPSQWKIQNKLRVTAYWFWCPGFIPSWWSCYQDMFNLLQIILSYYMNTILNFGSVI